MVNFIKTTESHPKKVTPTNIYQKETTLFSREAKICTFKKRL